MAIIGKDPASGRVRPSPKQPGSSEPQRQNGKRGLGPKQLTASGCSLWCTGPRPPPPPLYRAPQRQVAGRPKVVVIFDWFGVLSRSWDTRLRRFSNRFLLAFNRFLFELRPIEVGICSYADTNRDKYLRDCLRCGPSGGASGLLAATNQPTHRAGGGGLFQVFTNYFPHFVVRADPAAGEQGLIDDLENIQQNVESRDRNRLPVARQLANFEFLFDPRAPPPRGQR